MNSTSPTEPKGSAPASPAPFNAAAIWQRLKSSRVSFLTLPLLIAATITEFVILATGWKYQQTVCLPQGMGVTFFGIGPIGATILAVELLKLPLAIWTASRAGLQKGFMLFVGLPLICLLTFQLVKDMAVYEMGTAMAPAGQLLEQAAAEETKIKQLNGELASIETRKIEREKKLAEFAAKKEKAKADMEEALKRNDESRKDAISLTDYQKQELSEVGLRQSSMARAYDNDAAQLSRAIAELRTRREAELARASKWNVEEARIENAYKKKLSEYTNKKNAYEKAKAEYENASVLRRQVMSEPVDPGVPPEREVNTLLKPTVIDDLDEQIKAKEAELVAVNNKRRDSVALVADDARRMREDFDKRSSTKREEADRQRDAILAAQAAALAQLAAEEKQLDADLAVAVQKVDGIRDEIGAAQKKAESLYEAREASIRGTQVHRIATTVEIVRGMLFGERPMSINASAKERGDVLTDQISMVRIWVYPVMAFIVAFLPTLMVEIGFSTLFKPEQLRPQHRLGFMGRRLHELYMRAGRQKILRAERLASEVSAEIALRDKALAKTRADFEKALEAAKADAAQQLAAKEIELEAARNEADALAGAHEQELKQREAGWTVKFTGMADSLHRAISENDALRDFQKSEVERQVQLRQNAWSDRVAQLRKELDEQRAAAETERATLLEEHHKRLMEVTEDGKKQVFQARRQMAEAELASVEKNARLSNELKEARHARDTAEFQLKHQSDALAGQLAQAEADKAREIEKLARQEKIRFERQQADFEKTQRQHEEDFENRLKQQEQELTLAFEARLVQEKAKVEQEARLREAELGLSHEAGAREIEAHWSREVKQREEAALARLKQREQQLTAQAEARLRDSQSKADEQLRRRELEFERQHDAQAREAETRLQEELQQQEIAFHTKLKQREQELATKAAGREMELQAQSAADLRARQGEWEQQVESRIRAVETRMAQEAQAKEENFQQRLRQREQQLQAQFNEREAALQSRWDQEVRRREELAADARLREQDLQAKLAAEHEAHEAARMDLEMELEVVRGTIEPLRALLAQAEKDCNAERQSADEGIRHAQDLRKKLMVASSALSNGRNGRSLAPSRG